LRLHIPDIGDTITLAADWSFPLYKEYRNDDVWDSFADLNSNMNKFYDEEREIRRLKYEHAHIEYFDAVHSGKPQETIDFLWSEYIQHHVRYHLEPVAYPITLPKNTELKVDRVFIRKGASDYSSITFNISKTDISFLTSQRDGGTMKKGRKRRFWVKLKDANTMEIYE
jgi:hypothetical protein